MNNNQKLFKLMSVQEYDISITALAVLLKMPASTLNKYLNTRNITDEQLQKIERILESGNWELVFKKPVALCERCGKEFEKVNHCNKYCSKECADIVKLETAYKNNQKIKVERKEKLKYGENQKLLAKEVLKFNKNGTSFADEKKKRDIAYYESQFVKLEDRERKRV